MSSEARLNCPCGKPESLDDGHCCLCMGYHPQFAQCLNEDLVRAAAARAPLDDEPYPEALSAEVERRKAAHRTNDDSAILKYYCKICGKNEAAHNAIDPRVDHLFVEPLPFVRGVVFMREPRCVHEADGKTCDEQCMHCGHACAQHDDGPPDEIGPLKAGCTLCDCAEYSD